MELYLYKFSGCLFVFYLMYVIFLEKQNNHHFKRFYLLGAVISSLAIPFITITTYIESDNQLEAYSNDLINSEAFIANGSNNASFMELTDLIWIMYMIGALVFLVRFCINLRRLYKDISNNEALLINPLTYILLEKPIIPHSFLKYIFLHKPSYKKGDIPEEVILHEETHAKQLHSIDILLLEFIQIIFWFHPLIYVIKQHIKLNHEFLADHAVLNQGISTKNYQYILLQYSSDSNHHQLASAINYSSIKKRFTVMRTQTSKTRIWLSTLLLIPIFSLLLVSFTTKKEVLIDNSNLSSQQINSNPTFLEFILDMESQDARFYLDDNPITVDKAKSIARNNKGKQTEMLTQKDDNGTYIVKLYTVSKSEYARSIEVEVLGNNAYLIDGNRATKTSFRDAFDQLHQDISKEVRSKVINIHVTSTETLSNDEVWFIYNALEDYGYHRIVTKNQEIVRSKGNTPFATENHPSVSNTQLKIQEGATKQQMDEYNRLAKSYNSQPEGRRIVKMKDYKRMKYIYDLMSPEQRKAAQPLPKLPPPPPRAMHKGKVNDGIFNKYNKWIKGLKNSDGTYKQISSGEQKYYQSIYDNMTDDQKKRSAGLPPPPPPPRSKTIKVKETPPPPPPPKPAIAEKVTKKVQEVPPPPPKPVVVEVVEVPPPPPPPEPLEYVKSMAESNAIFYYEGKRISAKEAISIVRKNESINLKTKKSDTRTPEVYLSKRPMVKEIKRN